MILNAIKPLSIHSYYLKKPFYFKNWFLPTSLHANLRAIYTKKLTKSIYVVADFLTPNQNCVT